MKLCWTESMLRLGDAFSMFTTFHSVKSTFHKRVNVMFRTSVCISYLCLSINSEDDTKVKEIEELGSKVLPDTLEPELEPEPQPERELDPESEPEKTSLDASLPPHSKERYMAVYDTYLAWMKSKEEVSFSEDVMMTYFNEIAEKFKPSTLWAQYSMLKATINYNHGIDIGRYTQVLKFLKKKSDGYTSTKARKLSAEQVERFLVEAPDREYLATKV